MLNINRHVFKILKIRSIGGNSFKKKLFSEREKKQTQKWGRN